MNKHHRGRERRRPSMLVDSGACSVVLDRLAAELDVEPWRAYRLGRRR